MVQSGGCVLLSMLIFWVARVLHRRVFVNFVHESDEGNVCCCRNLGNLAGIESNTTSQ